MISVEESGAFVELFEINPTGSGILNSLCFAAKDLMDISGRVTGCGNPTWKKTHTPASANAVCVEQLLSAGAKCIGTTITDELAFSLLGENFFYGTPLNPKAPDRVPGGSSCGSASAVACGLVDFALGTDTGGSVRVPAANCGIFGFRPTHDRTSLAGVNPLSPTFDTVGAFATNLDILKKVLSILLAFPVPGKAEPENVYFIREAFDLCDSDVTAALQQPFRTMMDRWGSKTKWISMREIDQENSATALQNWGQIYRVLQWAEADSCLGSWVRAANPEFGPMIKQSFELIRTLDRSKIQEMIERRENYFRRVNSFLGIRDLICIPTAPAPAPIKGSIVRRDQTGTGYYSRALCLTSIAGAARLPQITLPIADINGIPLGVSLLARNNEDAFLLGVFESSW
ncbi:MAG: amidase [Acidobacteria bacterium]|nr:MAG: amidase [Acidobacteriota bacterium]